MNYQETNYNIQYGKLSSAYSNLTDLAVTCVTTAINSFVDCLHKWIA